MPTVLAAAGVEAPHALDGGNLLDLMARKGSWREAYYVQSERRRTRTLMRCVRTASHKLILSWDEAHELYDLTVDPEEELNIFDVPRADKQHQYRHFEDQSGTIIDLATRLLKRARELEDFAGIEMASRVLRQKGIQEA